MGINIIYILVINKRSTLSGLCCNELWVIESVKSGVVSCGLGEMGGWTTLKTPGLSRQRTKNSLPLPAGGSG